MKDPYLEKEWRRIRGAMTLYLTVQITVLAVTLVQIPTLLHAYSQLGYMPLDGWPVLWLFLEMFGLSIALTLLVSPYWRRIPFAERMNPVFGYFGAAWVGLVAFIFHVPATAGFTYLVAAVGLVWLIAFYLARRNRTRPEEIFP